MDMVYRGSESPGYYPPSTPPHQHHQKGRPRKRKLGPGNVSPPCGGELPMAMRMAQVTLGNYIKSHIIVLF